MKLFNLIIILLVTLIRNNRGFKTNHKVSRSSKSIFSNKEYTESVLPARYTAKNNQLEDSTSKINTPSSSFVGMDYPMNIVDSSKPYYFRSTIDNEKNDALLSSFPDYVKSTFKTLNDKSSDKIHAKIKDEYKGIFSKAISNLQSNASNTRTTEKDKNTSPVLENITSIDILPVIEEMAKTNDTKLINSTEVVNNENNSKGSSQDNKESVETELIIYDDSYNVDDGDIVVLSDNDNNSTDNSDEFLEEIFRVLEVIEKNVNNSTQIEINRDINLLKDEKLAKDKL